jgi:hypothetical protein
LVVQFDLPSATILGHQERRLAELEAAVANILLLIAGPAEAADDNTTSAEHNTDAQSTTTATYGITTPKVVSPQPLGHGDLCNIVKQEVKTKVSEIDVQLQKNLKNYTATIDTAKISNLLHSKKTFKKEIVEELHRAGHRVCTGAPENWEKRLEVMSERAYRDGFRDGLRELVSQEVRKHLTPALESIIHDRITSETAMAGKPLRELASQTQRALEEGRSVRDDLRNEKVIITKLVKYIKDYDQRVKEETAALKDVPKAIESAKAEIKAMVSRNTKVIEKAIKDLEKAAKKPSTQIAKLETKAFDEAVLRLDEKVADAVANIKQAEVASVEVLAVASASVQQSIDRLKLATADAEVTAATFETGLKETVEHGRLVDTRLQNSIEMLAAKEEEVKEAQTVIVSARDLEQTSIDTRAKVERQVDLARDEIMKEMVRSIKAVFLAGQMTTSPANDRPVGVPDFKSQLSTTLAERIANTPPAQAAQDGVRIDDGFSGMVKLQDERKSRAHDGKQSDWKIKDRKEKGKGREAPGVDQHPPVKTWSAEWKASTGERRPGRSTKIPSNTCSSNAVLTELKL